MEVPHLHVDPVQRALGTGELLQLIIDIVARESTPTTNAMRQLRSLCLVNQSFLIAARPHIFRRIRLSAEDDVSRIRNVRFPVSLLRRVIVESGSRLFEEIAGVQYNRRQILDVGNLQVYPPLPPLPEMPFVNELEWAIVQDWVPQSTPGIIRLFEALTGGIHTLVLNTNKILNLEQLKYLLSFCEPLKRLEIWEAPQELVVPRDNPVPFAEEAANTSYDFNRLEFLTISTKESCRWITALIAGSSGGRDLPSLRSLSVSRLSLDQFLPVLDMVSNGLRHLSVQTDMAGPVSQPHFDHLPDLPSLRSLEIGLEKIPEHDDQDTSYTHGFSWSNAFISTLLRAPLLESVTFSCILASPEDLSDLVRSDEVREIIEWRDVLKDIRNLQDSGGSIKFPNIRKIYFDLSVSGHGEDFWQLEARNDIRREIQNVFLPVEVDLRWAFSDDPKDGSSNS